MGYPMNKFLHGISHADPLVRLFEISTVRQFNSSTVRLVDTIVRQFETIFALQVGSLLPLFVLALLAPRNRRPGPLGYTMALLAPMNWRLGQALLAPLNWRPGQAPAAPQDLRKGFPG